MELVVSPKIISKIHHSDPDQAFIEGEQISWNTMPCPVCTNGKMESGLQAGQDDKDLELMLLQE